MTQQARKLVDRFGISEEAAEGLAAAGIETVSKPLTVFLIGSVLYAVAAILPGSLTPSTRGR